MDPSKETAGDTIVAPGAGYMLIVLAFLVKSATWMVGLLTDGAVEPDSYLGPYTTAMNSLM